MLQFPRFVADSLLEGRGFEPLVPLTTETHFRAPIDAPSCAHGVKRDRLGLDAAAVAGLRQDGIV